MTEITEINERSRIITIDKNRKIRVEEIPNKYSGPEYLVKSIKLIMENSGGKKEKNIWLFARDGKRDDYQAKWVLEEVDGIFCLISYVHETLFKEIVLLEEVMPATSTEAKISIDGRTTIWEFQKEKIRGILIEKMEAIKEANRKEEELYLEEEKKLAEEARKCREEEVKQKKAQKRVRKGERWKEILSRPPMSFWNQSGEQFFGTPITKDEWSVLGGDRKFGVIVENGEPKEVIIVKIAPDRGRKIWEKFSGLVYFSPPFLEEKPTYIQGKETINFNSIYLKNGNGDFRVILISPTQAENTNLLGNLYKGMEIAVDAKNKEDKYPLYIWNGEFLELKGYYPKCPKSERRKEND